MYYGEKHESDLTWKEKAELEIRKIRSLSGKKKAEYFWCYYKCLIAAVTFLILVISVVTAMYRNSEKNTVLSIAVIDADRRETSGADRLMEYAEDILDVQDENDEVAIDTSAVSGGTAAQSIKTAIAFSLIGGNDIIICGGNTYEEFREQGADFDETVELSSCERWKALGIADYEPVYACIPAKARNRENARKLVQYLGAK